MQGETGIVIVRRIIWQEQWDHETRNSSSKSQEAEKKRLLEGDTVSNMGVPDILSFQWEIPKVYGEGEK